MKIVVPVYGLPVWKPMLQAFCQRFTRAQLHLKHDLHIISDGSQDSLSWINSDLFSEFPVIRHLDHHDITLKVHNPLNTSGHLLAKASIHHSPCLVVTLDCIMRSLPAHTDWRKSDLALGEDPAKREHWLFGLPFLELNCAVAWFKSTRPGLTYNQAWKMVENDPKIKNLGCGEQVVWSFVHQAMRTESKHHFPYQVTGTADIYPREMNWSHHWGPHDNARIIHHHGPSKWEACV